MSFNLPKFILKIDREVSNYLNVNNLGNGRLFMAASGCTSEICVQLNHFDFVRLAL